MNKEIKLRTFLIIIVVLVIIEATLLFFLMPKQIENYCERAICNEDATICAVYGDNDKIIWRGSCSNDN